MKTTRAFTLIEILVVIAILAGLTSILLPNFMDARMRSRDSKRKADLANIQKALELYKLNQNPQSYPAALPNPCTQFADPSMGSVVYMQKVPFDPLSSCSSPKSYYYVPTLPDAYALYACIEDVKDPDQNVSTPCPNGFTCSSKYCYKLTQP